MLDEQYAVTLPEIEARASEQPFSPLIDAYPVDPHHLTTARLQLADDGVIQPTTGPTTSHPIPLTTWSRVPSYGIGERIKQAAGRKRLLTARHNGWSNRGGSGLGLIGAAGEQAAHKAMLNAQANGHVAKVTGSVSEVLGVNAGELDNSAWHLDFSTSPPTPILILVEVKNTRTCYYPSNKDDLLHFLGKAARIQAANPSVRMMPVLVARRVHFTTWDLGTEHGFLPAFVRSQLVLPDHELTELLFQEVQHGLGFADMILSGEPTNSHLGIFNHSIAKFAPSYSLLWHDSHAMYLPSSTDIKLPPSSSTDAPAFDADDLF